MINIIKQQYLDFDIKTTKSENIFNKITTDPLIVSFRDLVPEIKDTSYLTHSIYYYPAKFIPHVVKYCIENLSKENDLIIDPFAGSGTVGLEALLMKRNAFLIDINLLLNHIIPIKAFRSSQFLKKGILIDKLNQIYTNNSLFCPAWNNLDYWYPKEFLDILKKYWGGQKILEQDKYALIIEASLIKVSKYFSYAEHKTPKLFKSKSKKKLVEELLNIDWQKKLTEMIHSTALTYLERVNEMLMQTNEQDNTITYRGGVDSTKFIFNKDIQLDLLITSPPYLQAQEYIRTSKMDLYWLGYNDEDIKKITRLEIPYRK
ncbi:MAG: site-specific DNA-methyltransferase, partial [Spirochaetota bacterium]|nr:site-specific DNA-methyltransferase [Spirochaetota bacterium]